MDGGNHGGILERTQDLRRDKLRPKQKELLKDDIFPTVVVIIQYLSSFFQGIT